MSRRKPKPRIVRPYSDKRKPGVVLNRIVWIGLAAVATALYFAPQGDGLPVQPTHWEHQADRQAIANGMDRRQENEMRDLIDESLAASDARKYPKAAVAVLELYGTDREADWAYNVAKGQKP